MDIISDSPSRTEEIGEELGVKILKKKNDEALVIALTGDLGGGKTTFLKGLARGLGIKETVLSPTFIIFRRYDIDKVNFNRFYHFDCYRINGSDDILTLGFKNIISDSGNVIAIEWSERIEDILPENHLKVRFEFIDEETRKISFN